MITEQVAVCLVTPGHPSTNPRLVKEADTLVEAGYEVTVICTRFVAWADEADRHFADRAWYQPHPIAFGELASPSRRNWQRIRHRCYRLLFAWFEKIPGIAERALHPAYPELLRAALGQPADLYIAHNLAALPAAYAAARKHGAVLGFDAEDFHRGEFEPGELVRRIVETIENRYLGSCDYVTAASPGIAQAYADCCKIDRPSVVLNVFPLEGRPDGASAESRERSRRSLYWFSQTIGPDRGLENAVEAIAHSSSKPTLVLRGQVSSEYKIALLELAKKLGIAGRLVFAQPSCPSEMVSLAAQSDIGLALEQPVSENRKICLTNKIFTYLMAGIPSLASDTPAQLDLARECEGAVFVFRGSSAAEMAKRIDELLERSSKLEHAKRRARRLAVERFNWGLEKTCFLDAVTSVLATREL